MTKKALAAFSLAREVAAGSDFRNIHYGCLITYKGMPVASGHNSEKTHPMQHRYNRFRENNGDPQFKAKLHAEIAALTKIRNMDLNPKKLSIYVYRIRRDRQFSMARPCPTCMQALKDAGIRHIYYTTDQGYAEEWIA